MIRAPKRRRPALAPVLTGLVRTGLVLAGMALATGPGAARAQTASETARPDYAALIPALVREVAVPATEALEARLRDLRGRIDDVCAAEAGEAARDAFRDAFAGAVAAQGRLAVLRFGALAEDTRLERLAFVPDRRNVVWRQVTRLTASRDPGATDPDVLRDKSVALQGLTALEWIAFGGDGEVRLAAEADDGFACAYARALGARLSDLALEIRTAYETPTGQTAQLLAPGPDNALAQTEKAAAGFAFNQLTTSLSLMADQVLTPVLEPGPAEARAARAPFARSHLAARHLAASIDGFAEALRRAGYTRAAPDLAWMDNTLAFEAKNAGRALAALPADLAVALADEDDRQRLIYVRAILTGLQSMVGGQLAGALDFEGGFNALDGD
ncbi:imelysin family protein [Stappia sp.]|uniref:imelysin family protein n=1 Tax=Stappia sp. TaxID=1870903 RepID=UPI0032D90C36